MNLTNARTWGAAAWITLVVGFWTVGTTTLHAQARIAAPPLAGRVQTAPRPIPAKVEAVLKSIDETGKAPAGVLGGRVYENHGRDGEKLLPRTDRDGDAITYHTWDVNARGQERDRGQERLVTGSDGSAYFTIDYYKNFQTVRNPSRSVHVAPATVGRPNPTNSNNNGATSGRNRPANAEKPIVTLEPRVASRIMPVVEYILTHKEPPPETVGGRNFGNFGSEDGEVLPKTDSGGRVIHYREWDVNKKVAGRNRGAERLITGSDGRVYYTHDHYDTFQRIK